MKIIMLYYLGLVSRTLKNSCSFKDRTHEAAELNGRVLFSLEKCKPIQLFVLFHHPFIITPVVQPLQTWPQHCC